MDLLSKENSFPRLEFSFLLVVLHWVFKVIKHVADYLLILFP